MWTSEWSGAWRISLHPGLLAWSRNIVSGSQQPGGGERSEEVWTSFVKIISWQDTWRCRFKCWPWFLWRRKKVSHCGLNVCGSSKHLAVALRYRCVASFLQPLLPAPVWRCSHRWREPPHSSPGPSRRWSLPQTSDWAWWSTSCRHCEALPPPANAHSWLEDYSLQDNLSGISIIISSSNNNNNYRFYL